MKYHLSEFRGRDELPTDKLAFDRLKEVFKDIPKIINTQRRERIQVSEDTTKLGE